MGDNVKKVDEKAGEEGEEEGSGVVTMLDVLQDEEDLEENANVRLSSCI